MVRVHRKVLYITCPAFSSFMRKLHRLSAKSQVPCRSSLPVKCQTHMAQIEVKSPDVDIIYSKDDSNWDKISP